MIARTTATTIKNVLAAMVTKVSDLWIAALDRNRTEKLAVVQGYYVDGPMKLRCR
jgi:hypothetical protein